MSEIEKALCEVTGIARGKKEAPQVYRKRLLTKLEKVFDDKKSGDDDWDSLGKTKGAQEWFNDAIKADKADKDLPEFEADDLPRSKEAEPEEAAEAKEPEADESEQGAETETETQGDGDVAGKKRKATGGAGKTKTAAKKPVKATAGNSHGKKPESAPRKQPGKAGGSLAYINELMLKDPAQSIEDLEASLGKKGYKPTRLVVSAARSRIRQTFRVLQEAGHLKGLKL